MTGATAGAQAGSDLLSAMEWRIDVNQRAGGAFRQILSVRLELFDLARLCRIGCSWPWPMFGRRHEKEIQ